MSQQQDDNLPTPSTTAFAAVRDCRHRWSNPARSRLAAPAQTTEPSSAPS